MKPLTQWAIVMAMVVSAIALPALMILWWGWAEAFIGCLALAGIKLVLLGRADDPSTADGMARGMAVGMMIILLTVMMTGSYLTGLILAAFMP